jgi:hypothetical protein
MTRFIDRARDGRKQGWKDHVPIVAFRTLLESLSGETATVSNTLRASILQSASSNADFALNHGREPDQRLECLQSFERNSAINYQFYLSKEGEANKTYPIICCRPSHSDKKTRRKGETDSLEDVFRQFQAQPSSKRTITYRESFSGTQFSFDYQGSATLSSHCLKSILAQKDLRKNLSLSERIQLSYEVAECALLFLRTRWFSELCTCAVRRNVVQQDLKTTFTLRLGNVKHKPCIHNEDSPPWCTQELKEMHICRVGVLLTELALSKLAFDVRTRSSFNAVEIDFTGDPSKSSLTPLEDLLREVEIAASEDIKEAVKHCFLQKTAPEAITRDQIEEFYDDVVRP